MPRKNHVKLGAALSHACTLDEAARQALILELVETLSVAEQSKVREELSAALEKQQLQALQESARGRARSSSVGTSGDNHNHSNNTNSAAVASNSSSPSSNGSSGRRATRASSTDGSVLQVSRVQPVTPTHLRHSRRRLLHVLLGEARHAHADGMVASILRNAWCLILVALAGTVCNFAVPALPIGNPDAAGRVCAGPGRGWRRLSQGLLYLPLVLCGWLLMDVDIMRELCTYFAVWWLVLNALVLVVCSCIVHCAEPAYIVGSACLALTLGAMPYLDAVPWNMLPHWHVARMLCFLAYVAILALSASRIYLADAVRDEVAYDPVILNFTYVSTTTAELGVQANWNLLIFAIGLTAEAIIHPQSYVMWKSRLNAELVESGERRGTGLQRVAWNKNVLQLSTSAPAKSAPSGLATSENPMVGGTGTAVCISLGRARRAGTVI